MYQRNFNKALEEGRSTPDSFRSNSRNVSKNAVLPASLSMSPVKSASASQGAETFISKSRSIRRRSVRSRARVLAGQSATSILLFMILVSLSVTIFWLQTATIGKALHHDHLPSFFNTQKDEDSTVKELRLKNDGKNLSEVILAPTTDRSKNVPFFLPGGYVHGEKSLKRHLKKLLVRQEGGADLGVPIRPRWSDVITNGEESLYDKESISDEKVLKEDAFSNLSKGNNKSTNQHFTLYENSIPMGKRKLYPSPLPSNAEIVLKPSFGVHRPDVDAVFVFAEGYDLSIYAMFIESLRFEAKFQGDIVLSVSHLSKLAKGVESYLRSFKSGVVVYTVDWKCFSKKNGASIESANAGLSDCAIHGLYGHVSENKMEQVKDPREPRPVATARYELYWAWSLQYNPHQMIFLIDARDTYFQADPFQNLMRSDEVSTGGVLHLFEENFESTNIQKSSYNRGWITQAYGVSTAKEIGTVPVICSGSTIGEQVAIESYLRAMIAQFDKTKCKAKGCDQGFHNVLYYKKELEGTTGIDSIYTHEQGWSNVNNLGAMAPVKSVEEWDLLNESGQVKNWNKLISPVVHQFDRFKPLATKMNAKKREIVGKVKRKTV